MAFKYLQELGFNPVPGQHVLIFNNPFHKEILLNIYSKPH